MTRGPRSRVRREVARLHEVAAGAIALGAVAAALGAGVAACGAPPVKSSVVPAIAAASAPVSGLSSASPPPAAVAPISRKVLAERVTEAYEIRARGDGVQARAAFAEVVKLLASAGEKQTPGLGDSDGYVVRGRTKAAFTKRNGGVGDTLFFDIDSGEPFAFVPDMGLRPGTPPLDGSYFMTVRSEGLFNPTLSTFAKLPGALLAVHPDGRRAYVLGEDCRVREIGIEKNEMTRALAAHSVKGREPQQGSRPECDAYGFRDAAITADGKWLSTRFGRWNLSNGLHRALPLGSKGADYEPAVSPDGRYIARVMRNPRASADDLTTALVLVLQDLDTGAVKTAPEALSFLSNGDPLWFGAHPPRVCIFDYGFYAYEVPSLRKYEPGDSALVPDAGPVNFGPDSCEAKFVRPAPEHPALAARLASRVCTLGGFLLPAEHCAKPGG